MYPPYYIEKNPEKDKKKLKTHVDLINTSTKTIFKAYYNYKYNYIEREQLEYFDKKEFPYLLGITGGMVTTQHFNGGVTSGYYMSYMRYDRNRRSYYRGSCNIGREKIRYLKKLIIQYLNTAN